MSTASASTKSLNGPSLTDLQSLVANDSWSGSDGGLPSAAPSASSEQLVSPAGSFVAGQKKKSRGSEDKQHKPCQEFSQGLEPIRLPLDAAIRASYSRFGLDDRQLIISYTPLPLNPLALFMGSTAKTRSVLTNSSVANLVRLRDELIDHVPVAGDPHADRRNIELVRHLCKSSVEPVRPTSLVEVVKKLRLRSNVTADELNLTNFLNYSVMIVTKQYDEAQVSRLCSFFVSVTNRN